MSVSKLAEKVIDAYAHDPLGLMHDEFDGLGLNEDQVELLCSVLGRGFKGVVTNEERKQLAAAGLSLPELFVSLSGSGSYFAFLLDSYGFQKWGPNHLSFYWQLDCSRYRWHLWQLPHWHWRGIGIGEMIM